MQMSISPYVDIVRTPDTRTSVCVYRLSGYELVSNDKSKYQAYKKYRLIINTIAIYIIQ